MSAPSTAAAKVVQIGLGYWGRILLQKLSAHPELRISTLCDHHVENLILAKSLAPGANLANSFSDVLREKYDLGIVSTSASTHATVALELLDFCSALFVEKPLGLTLSEGQQILDKARRLKKKLFVGHTYLFSPNYLAFKNEFGKVKLDSRWQLRTQRTDLGSFPRDCDILAHLFYHDLYMLDDLLGLENLVVEDCHYSTVLSPNGPDHAVIRLRHRSHGEILSEVSMASIQKHRLYVLTHAHGGLTWDDLNRENPLILQNREVRFSPDGRASLGTPEKISLSHKIDNFGKETLVLMVNHLVRSLKTSEESWAEAERSIRVLSFLNKLPIPSKVRHAG